MGQLHSGDADTAGGTGDEHPFPGTETTLGEERVIGGAERLGEAPGLVPRNTVGHGHRRPLGDDDQLGLAASSGDGHDPVAEGEAPGARSHSDHLARQLHAGDVGRVPGRCGIEAHALHEVGGVDAGSPDRDQDLPGAGFGVGVPEPLEGVPDDGDGVHEPRVDGTSCPHAAHPVQPIL